MSTVAGFLIGQHGKLSGLRVAIPPAGLVIGRDPKEADVVLEDTLVSRRHAQLGADKNGQVFVADLQSRNGTFHNARKITAPVALSPGDKVAFGGENAAIFVFESAATPSVTGVLKQAFGEHFAPVEWKPGDVILDTYEVLDLLGQGGMGKVYRVHHKSWNMDLAVKSPLPGLFNEEKSVENFIREAETWVNLNLHPNIVQCFYVRTIGGIPRIFAEYVPGGTLASWIKNRKLTQLDQILDVAIQFAWGLHAAHEQGIVHQDVKPLNVLMTPDGIAKVSDFGLARSKPVTRDNAATTPDNMVTMAGTFTIAYCSPEQARGEKLSRKTDIWSWAVSVLEMFTGGIVWQNGLQAPAVLKAYRSMLGPKFAVKMPKDLARLLEKCLFVHLDDRPKDMREVAVALQNVHYCLHSQVYPRTEPQPAEHLADSLNNRGVSLVDLGKTEDALQVWDKAIQIEPGHLESTYNRTLTLWRFGRIDREAAILQVSPVESQREIWESIFLWALILGEGGRLNSNDGGCDPVKWLEMYAPQEAEIRELVAAMRRTADLVAKGSKPPEFRAPLRLCRTHLGTERLADEAAYQKAVEEASVAFKKLDLRTCASLVRTARKYRGCGRRREAVDLWFSLYPHLPKRGGKGGWLSTVLKHDVWQPEVSAPHSIQLSADGKQLLVSDALDRSSYNDAYGVELWDLAGCIVTEVFEADRVPIHSVHAVAESCCVFGGAEDGRVHYWQHGSRRPEKIFRAHRGPVSFVWATRDSRVVLTCGRDGEIRRWDSRTGHHLGNIGNEGEPILAACMSPDESQIFTARLTEGILVHDVATGRLVQHLVKPWGGKTQFVSLGSNGEFAVSVNTIGDVEVWKLDAFDLSSDDSLLMTDDALLLMMGGSQADMIVRKGWATSGQTEGCAIPTFDRRYILTDLHGDTAIRDMATQNPVVRFKGQEAPVTSLGVSMDGRLFVSKSRDRAIRVWSIDWELEDKADVDWVEEARLYLRTFLTLHTPHAGELPENREPTEKEICAALSRRGKPVWSEADFQRLLHTLGCAGYGWLRPEGVRRELEKMATTFPVTGREDGGLQ
jgi:serine/threonine protein kinase